MKKVITAMVVMFFLIVWLGGGIWVSLFSKIMGGGVSETYLYPIYGGIILLAGLMVGCTVYICYEIHSVHDKEKNRQTSSENTVTAE